MNHKEHQEAAIRKAAREISKPLREQLAKAERMIDVLTQKLEDTERQLIDARRRLLNCQRNNL